LGAIPKETSGETMLSKEFMLCAAGALVVGACAGGTSRVSTATASPTTASPGPATARRDIRDLAIIPSAKSVCPGQPVSVRYQAILGDGSRVDLGQNELSRLALRGIAAEPAPNGSWSTSANPLESAVSGFRLSVSLATDPGVHADTVIVPSYTCNRLSIGLPVSDRFNETKARVRLGVFASPFYDSIAVAVIEPEGGYPITLIIDPSHMRARALTVSAVGKIGAAGGPGNPGNDGGQCEDGGDGTDGDPGESGQRGGQVDLVIESEAPWLESLVGVSNSGGKGGAGGRGGRAGRPGARANDPPCNPKAGRPGRAGRQGDDGSSGPYPKTTKEPRSLLWHGSPIWFDSTARANLERLIELGAPRRGRP
jgi:hypothetical protein